ncbi:SDR family NAD(P)-dependent oxidoreductase [Lacisediminimonas sp.]|uniref:SDR family NAD(P)-dependent oxidoreductase n=1 Tax=Lacisediminimonas sp. TaxID=3060582 RepID=UPI0027194183|nr:SDR family oxidoreductase [Lacisediminimonas sp.]MDO8298717.1 SDR family oxidoreductase [Lacisediminimonas sp.]MDO9216204.1 SDR family oxidoreductase [Lacisediminimonas sp.]
MDKPLQGQVAVITGGGRGIGRAIALGYAAAGAAVCCSSRSSTQLDETVALIIAAGGRAIGIPADVTDTASMAQLFAETDKAFGRVDIVVACAGDAAENKLVAESDPMKWKQIIETNLIGAFQTAHAAIPLLRRAGAGKMIFIGSGMGHRSGPTRSAYASSKAGLWMLVRILSQELVADNIAVNELIPGPVMTDFIKGREGTLGAGSEWLKQPEDVVPMALFMATQPATGPTGQTFSLARREL